MRRAAARVRACGARRGVALPMVLVALVIAGLFVAMTLDRFASQTADINRQLQAYQDHHAQRGIAEVVTYWDGVNQPDLYNYLEEDPTLGSDEARLALTIESPSDGSRIRVLFRDGQGGVLSDVRAIDAETFALADEARYAVIDELNARGVSREEAAEYLRPVGPAAISVNAASDLVLETVLDAILGPGDAANLFRAISRLRAAEERVTSTQLGDAISGSGLDAEAQQEVTRMITAVPVLYFAEIEILPRRGGVPLARYGGYISVGGEEGRSQYAQGGTFLTWERLDDGAR